MAKRPRYNNNIIHIIYLRVPIKIYLRKPIRKQVPVSHYYYEWMFLVHDVSPRKNQISSVDNFFPPRYYSLIVFELNFRFLFIVALVLK